MASEFLQMVVVVELRNPSERLHGSVTGVEAGQSLTLSNVWSLDRQTWQPQVIVDPSNIVDIFDASKASGLPLAPASAQQTSTTPAYEDPAILSFKIGAVRPDSGPGRGSRPPSKTHSATSASASGAGGLNISSLSRSVQSVPIKGPSPIAATVAKKASVSSFVPTKVSRTAIGSLDTAGTSDTAKSGPKAVRLEESQRQRRRARNTPATDTPAEGQTKQAGRGKGWRETPMLQDTASFQPFRALKKSGRQRQQPNQDNGWASEDVTDVQEMGDFDFEGSLAKFDKRTLFDQMRRDDQIADADRLVTHNRRPVPKLGTAGGRNLHHTENVLDLPSSAAAVAAAAAPASALPKSVLKEPQTLSQDFWNSEADDVGAVREASEGGRSNERGLGSRQSSRRGESKVSVTRRSQPRKASTSAAAGQVAGRSNAAAARIAHGSAYLERTPSQASLPPSSSRGFCLLPSRRRIETVSALQILNLENIAHNELGLTQDMMTENAGRGIAEVALTALADPAVTLRIRAASTSSSTARPNVPPPTIVVLAGNNKSGTRAIAGARHLRNRGVNVLLCVVGIERGERELLEDFRQQVQLYRNFGGRIYDKNELFEYLRKTTIPTLTIDTPRSAVVAKPPAVSLIVDALLGLTVSFDELRTGDQATVYELIEWANRNEAFVLAVDVPTGIDPTSGKISIIDGARLFLRPRYVVAMGAPKRGLLEAVSAGETEDGSSAESAVLDDPAIDWRLFIADIGLGAAVWKKAGTKIRRGIDFENKWVLEMKYIGAAARENAS